MIDIEKIEDMDDFQANVSNEMMQEVFKFLIQILLINYYF